MVKVPELMLRAERRGMRKASDIVHKENTEFDKIISDLDRRKLARTSKKNMQRPVYAYTKLEKELQDAKNRHRGV